MKLKKIFYLHIPKTGGQTLATRLASAFPYNKSSILKTELKYPDGIRDLKKLLETNFFIESHVSGPVLSSFYNIDILVTLRNPITQIVSNYLHIKRSNDSPFSRAANQLNAEKFFEIFGDFFTNFQAKWLISAFNVEDICIKNNIKEKTIFTENLINYQNQSLRVFSVLNKIKWIVPTEKIDEFTYLWMIENKKYIYNSEFSRNLADNKAEYTDLLSLVQSKPNLYSLDLMLWEYSNLYYNDYKKRVFRDFIDNKSPNSSMVAFSKGNEKICLGDGWCSPENNSYGLTWWAGPTKHSEIFFSRNINQKYLEFNIGVICGVNILNINIFDKTQDKKLEFSIFNEGDDQIRVKVDITSCELVDTIFLFIPEVFSPILISETDNNTRRISVATYAWRLSV